MVTRDNLIEGYGLAMADGQGRTLWHKMSGTHHHLIAGSPAHAAYMGVINHPRVVSHRWHAHVKHIYRAHLAGGSVLESAVRLGDAATKVHEAGGRDAKANAELAHTVTDCTKHVATKLSRVAASAGLDTAATAMKAVAKAAGPAGVVLQLGLGIYNAVTADWEGMDAAHKAMTALDCITGLPFTAMYDFFDDLFNKADREKAEAITAKVEAGTAAAIEMREAVAEACKAFWDAYVPPRYFIVGDETGAAGASFPEYHRVDPDEMTEAKARAFKPGDSTAKFDYNWLATCTEDELATKLRAQLENGGVRGADYAYADAMRNFLTEIAIADATNTIQGDWNPRTWSSGPARTETRERAVPSDRWSDMDEPKEFARQLRDAADEQRNKQTLIDDKQKEVHEQLDAEVQKEDAPAEEPGELKEPTATEEERTEQGEPADAPTQQQEDKNTGEEGGILPKFIHTAITPAINRVAARALPAITKLGKEFGESVYDAQGHALLDPAFRRGASSFLASKLVHHAVEPTLEFGGSEYTSGGAWQPFGGLAKETPQQAVANAAAQIKAGTATPKPETSVEQQRDEAGVPADPVEDAAGQMKEAGAGVQAAGPGIGSDGVPRPQLVHVTIGGKPCHTHPIEPELAGAVLHRFLVNRRDKRQRCC